MPIPTQMPKAINQCSLTICSESIPKWGSNPFVSFFCICKASTVIFTLFLLNITYSFFERRSPLFHLRWHDSLLLNLFAFIFSRNRLFWASTFSPWFCVLNKSFFTTGVRTQEDYCPLDLKSIALTTRP